MAKDKVAAFVEESKAETSSTANASAAVATPPIATASSGGSQVGAAQKVNPAAAQAAQQKAARQAAADARAQAAATRAQQKAARAAQQTATKQAAGVVGLSVGATNALAQPTADTVAELGDWIATRPAPGGIFVLLLVIFILLWLVVPVNGSYTRAQLLWMTLAEEKTSLKGASSTIGTDYNIPVGPPPTMTLSSSATVPSTVTDFAGGYAV